MAKMPQQNKLLLSHGSRSTPRQFFFAVLFTAMIPVGIIHIIVILGQDPSEEHRGRDGAQEQRPNHRREVLGRQDALVARLLGNEKRKFPPGL